MIRIGFIADEHQGVHPDAADSVARAALEFEALKVDAVFSLGDLFEAASTASLRYAHRKRFALPLRNAGIPQIYLRGNHSPPKDIESFLHDGEQMLVHERPGRVFLRKYADTGRAQFVPESEVQEGDLQVLTIPHMAAAQIAAEMGSRDEHEHTATKLLDLLVDDYFQKVRNHRGQSVVLFHGTIDGAQLDNGHIPRENGIHLIRARLEQLGCLVIGGHYHKHQAVGQNVYYVGAPSVHDFGEAGHDKGICVIEFDDRCPHPLPAPDVRFVSLSPRPVHLVEGQWIVDESGARMEWTSGVPADADAATFEDARVRVRYTIDQRLVSTWDPAALDLFSAANEVVPERTLNLETSVRSEAAAKALSVEEAIALYLGTVDRSPEDIEQLLALYQSIMAERGEDEVIEAGLQGIGQIRRIRSITVGGHACLADQTVKFPTVDQLAIVGDNGAGKTTLMDLVPGALFGSLPNRSAGSGKTYGGPSTLYDPYQFPGKNGLIDVAFEVGEGDILRVVRHVDGKLRKQVAHLFFNDEPQTEGKKAEFVDALARLFGASERLFLAALYATQKKRGNLSELDDAGKRELLAEAVDLTRFDRPFATFSAVAAEMDDIIRYDQARLQSLEASLPDETGLKLRLQEAHAERNVADEIVQNSEKDVIDAKATVANARANAQDFGAAQARVQRLWTQTREELTLRRAKRAAARATRAEILDQADEIRAARTCIEVGEARIREIDEKLQAQTERKGELQASVDERRGALKVERDRIDADIKVRRAERAKAERRQAELESEVKSLEGMAGRLDGVPCSSISNDAGPLIERCPLASSARDARDRLPALREELAAIELPDVSELETRLADIETRREAALADPDLIACQESITELSAERSRVLSEITRPETEDLARRFEHLGVAEARIKDMLDEAERAAARARTVWAEWLAGRAKLADARDLAETERKAQRIESEAEEKRAAAAQKRDELTEEIGGIEAQLKVAAERKAEIESGRAALNSLALKHADIVALKDALSPKGAQALLIDAAGPELSEIANGLLAEACGSRYTLGISTQRQNRSNDKTKEAIDIQVFDAESDGAPGMIGNKSGGQEAFLGEALSLAVAIYRRRRGGQHILFIMRDETNAALTDENATRYAKMLRRAQRIGGFVQLIYVTHRKHVQAEADAILLIQDGVVREVGFEQAADAA